MALSGIPTDDAGIDEGDAGRTLAALATPGGQHNPHPHYARLRTRTITTTGRSSSRLEEKIPNTNQWRVYATAIYAEALVRLEPRLQGGVAVSEPDQEAPVTEVPTQTELDRKINRLFQRVVVRKDLVKAVKGNAVLPTHLLKYLLGQYAALDEEATIHAGIDTVRRILADTMYTGISPGW